VTGTVDKGILFYWVKGKGGGAIGLNECERKAIRDGYQPMHKNKKGGLAMDIEKVARPKPSVKLTIEDTKGKTKEVFEITADEALAIQTLMHSLLGTAPKSKASWIAACKLTTLEK
jgi:hypothetical protein